MFVLPGVFISGVVACAQSPGSFMRTGKMNFDRYDYTATLLADGRVLVTGGFSEGPSGSASLKYLTSAEIYDPSTGTFALTGSMLTARSGHTATVLRDGRVLVTGGAQNSPVFSKNKGDSCRWTEPSR